MIDAIWEHDYYKDCVPNFSENLAKPRHRWYEFKEGYSDAFVSRAIRHYEASTGYNSGTVFDPFSGSGTTPLAGVQHGYNAIAIEVNPFMSFISQTKTRPYTGDRLLVEEELKAIVEAKPIEMESGLEGFSTFSSSDSNQKIFRECYRVAANDTVMWFIVSTSAYAGIEIPVDLLLVDLATKCGWELESVNALRNLRTSSQCIDSDIRKVRLRESMVACRK